VLLNPDVVGTAIEVLHDNPADMFYVEAHQHIYEAILTLYRTGVPVDAVTLMDRLVAEGKLETAGGVGYLAELTNAVPTSANIESLRQDRAGEGAPAPHHQRVHRHRQRGLP
jgi:replicative DNA helicase